MGRASRDYHPVVGERVATRSPADHQETATTRLEPAGIEAAVEIASGSSIATDTCLSRSSSGCRP